MINKLIIFDMDGVIFDSMEISQRYFIKRRPGVTPQMYKDIYCGNYYEESKRYDSLKLNLSPEEKQKLKLGYDQEKNLAPLFPDIKELLENLYRSGYKLVLNTSASTINSVPLLERVGIDKIFDFILSADVSKSKIEKFQTVKNKYQIDSQKIIFITDTLGDVKEADQVNIPTIAVTWGFHDHKYFLKETHHNLKYICDSVAELKKIILSL
jgi:phosphoglycolate phosphatase